MTTLTVPKHVAIIPDGNRRWAKERHLPTLLGHKKGADRVIELSRKGRALGVKVMTFWGFSTENWSRSDKEVGYLMNLFDNLIDRYLDEALEEEVRIIHLGRKDRLHNKLREKINNAEERTKEFSKHYLAIALDYGGRDEVLRAVNKYLNDPAKESQLTAESFEKYLDTSSLPYPNPDLVIRTSGEHRTSGLMIWQAAYAEYIFLKEYFPDFTPALLENCIQEYGIRQRRYGK